MSILTVASKANHALLLPALLTAALINKTDDKGQHVSLVFEDAESINGSEGYIQLKSHDGTTTVYDHAALVYLHDSCGTLQLGNKDLVAEWVSRSIALTVQDFKSMEKPLQELDHHLTLRSFVIGYSATLADFVLWGTIRGNKVLLPNVKRRGGNIFRWFSFIEAANPWMDQVLLNLNESARLKRAALSAAGGSYEIGLDGDNIVTRFPPEPSGYLHIGHAKAALLNDYFAHKNSGGTLICRFDDTNPSKESMEFQDAILSDLAVLGITPDRISYSSDHFQLMYELCLKLISAGNAYADDTELQPMRDQRRDGIPSARRDMSVEETLSHFEEMKSGSETGLKWCIRARISVDDPNKAMRDPVMYRCNLQPHHRTGTTWKMYPTYDFCAPVLDSAEGVTYALRTNEYRDRNAQYAWVQRTLGLREVTIWDFSRLSFVRTVLSKRKLTRLIELGAVSGWDDPRVPTVRGIKRRGLMIPALREFVLKQGPSRNVVNLDWTSIWAVNKKFIDPVASRFTAIEKEATVLTTVRGYSGEPSVEDKPRHAKYSSLGTKKVVYSDTLYLEQQDAQAFKLDEEVTLMNWGNAIVRQIERDPKSDLVAHVELELHLAGDVKQTSKKLTWLSAKGQDLVPVELVEFDHIITKDKLEKEDDISLYINWKSKMSAEALADCNVAGLVVDDIIQFDRKGYYRVDRPYSEGNPAVLFFIPTGRTS